MILCANKTKQTKMIASQEVKHFLQNCFYTSKYCSKEERNFCESLCLEDALSEIQEIKELGLDKCYSQWFGAWKSLSDKFVTNRTLFYLLMMMICQKEKANVHYMDKARILIRYSTLMESLAGS